MEPQFHKGSLYGTPLYGTLRWNAYNKVIRVIKNSGHLINDVQLKKNTQNSMKQEIFTRTFIIHKLDLYVPPWLRMLYS